MGPARHAPSNDRSRATGRKEKIGVSLRMSMVTPLISRRCSTSMASFNVSSDTSCNHAACTRPRSSTVRALYTVARHRMRATRMPNTTCGSSLVNNESTAAMVQPTSINVATQEPSSTATSKVGLLSTWYVPLASYPTNDSSPSNLSTSPFMKRCSPRSNWPASNSPTKRRLSLIRRFNSLRVRTDMALSSSSRLTTTRLPLRLSAKIWPTTLLKSLSSSLMLRMKRFSRHNNATQRALVLLRSLPDRSKSFTNLFSLRISVMKMTSYHVRPAYE